MRFDLKRSAPAKTDRVFYGEYKDTDAKMLALMKHLTGGKFEAGAISQEVLRACWTRGEAPTYSEFAKLWLKAREEHTKPNPEWAFLTDRAKGIAGRRLEAASHQESRCRACPAEKNRALVFVVRDQHCQQANRLNFRRNHAIRTAR